MARKGKRVDGNRIGVARVEAGYRTQAAFADRIGVHWTTMNRIENGKARVSLELVETIARETGESRDHFLLDEDDDAEAASMTLSRDLAVAIARFVDARVKA